MMHAYNEIYLQEAQYKIGTMLDYAVYDVKLDLEDFYNAFINSKLSRALEHGSPKYIAGRSGNELVHELFYELYGNDESLYDTSGAELNIKTDKALSGRSPEFWVGYSLAHYQWYSALSFRHINEIISIDKVLSMYPKYHEMDIRQFVDRMESLRNDVSRISRLKAYRMKLGMSQSELSSVSGIPLRTLQNYEQRQKNINKASVDYVVRLARALHCEVQELME
ncbi:MAG: helix-turn-helix transcriptional regulator [Lachnospiraceae bacterium]|nr:helix-turn-helix transcriptional regulator [Lachnospiraceae bacterium]